MTARRPLYYDAGHLREMSDSDVTKIQKKCVYLYGQSPSVTLEIDSSAGNLNSMIDTRKKAGTAASSFGDGDTIHGDAGDFVPETSTAEPGQQDTTYNQLKQVINTDTPPADDVNNRAFPVYYDGTDIRAMDSADLFDTFISPAINLLVADSDMDGTFRIHTATSLADHTLISNKPVFTDTRANTSLYSGGGIPETLDQPFDVTTFYLHRTNQGAAFGDTDYKLPFLIDTDNNLKRTTNSDFTLVLQKMMNHYTSSVAGSTIRYQIGGSGTTKGSVITDTRLDGAGSYNTRIVGTAGSSATVYRSQEFPNGTEQVINSYTLKIRRE